MLPPKKQKTLQNILNKPESFWTTLPIPVSKKAYENMANFVQNLSGLPAETVKWEANEVGGIFCKYSKHIKNGDNTNSIITVGIDFGDNCASFYIKYNNEIVTSDSFISFNELLNSVPLS